MTTYTFLSAQTPNSPAPPQVVIADGPTLGHVSLSVTGPNAGGTLASLWCQTATTPYGYTENIPLLTFYIPPGQTEAPSRDYALSNLQYRQFFYGQLDRADENCLTAATLLMVV